MIDIIIDLFMDLSIRYIQHSKEKKIIKQQGMNQLPFEIYCDLGLSILKFLCIKTGAKISLITNDGKSMQKLK